LFVVEYLAVGKAGAVIERAVDVAIGGTAMAAVAVVASPV
jgi:hypothetical protein